MAEKVIFEFEAPDGTILEWEGDETTPPEQVKAHFQSYLKSQQSPDSRGAGRLAAGQVGQAVKGAVMLPVRAGQMAYGVGEAAGEATGELLKGNVGGAVSRVGRGLSDLYHGIADPFEHAGQLVGELIAPGSQPGDIMDPDRLAQSAEAAGTNAAGVGLMTKPGQAVMKRQTPRIVPQADTLQGLANRAREYTQSHPIMEPIANAEITKPVKMATAVPKAAIRAAAKVAPPALDLAARAKAALEKPAPIVDKPAAQTGQEIPMNMPDETFQFQESAPVAQSEPIPMNMPDETFQFQESAPVAQSEPIPFKFPEVPEPMTAPAPMGKPTPTEVAMAEQALAPTGNQRRLSTIRNTPDLLELAPELRGLEAGPQFDATLHQGFKNMESMVDAAERSVPRTTRVSINDLKQDLLAVQADYTLRAMPQAVATVQKVLDKLNDRFGGSSGAVPWEDFLQVKRGLLKDSRSAASAPLRRAYGQFIKATEGISPELSKANKAYSTFMRALENANMDPMTGRRIGNVGKAPKPTTKPPSGPKPVGYDEGKGSFRMPL